MPNVTITIENNGINEESLNVRLIFYDRSFISTTPDNNQQYLLKSASAEKILTVIQDEAGMYPFEPDDKQLLSLTKLFYKEPHLLTSKEKQVLGLLSKGYSYKMIACELKKSVETIRVQIKSVYKKLNVCSNTQAVIKAINEGLL